MVDRIVCARTSWPLEVAANHILRKLRLRVACKFRWFKLIDGRTRIRRSRARGFQDRNHQTRIPRIYRRSSEARDAVNCRIHMDLSS